MRPVPGADIEYARATLITLQEEIAKADSILVIGAGPVGIEVAGIQSLEEEMKARRKIRR